MITSVPSLGARRKPCRKNSHLRRGVRRLAVAVARPGVRRARGGTESPGGGADFPRRARRAIGPETRRTQKA
jgi:hypothetical protein